MAKGNPDWLQKTFPNSSCAACEPDLVDYPGQYLDDYESPLNRSTSTNAHVASAAADFAEIAQRLAADEDDSRVRAAYAADAARYRRISADILATLSSELFYRDGLFLDGQGSGHSSIAAQYIAWGAGAPVGARGEAALRVFVGFARNKTFVRGRTEPAYSCMGAFRAARAELSLSFSLEEREF